MRNKIVLSYSIYEKITAFIFLLLALLVLWDQYLQNIYASISLSDAFKSNWLIVTINIIAMYLFLKIMFTKLELNSDKQYLYWEGIFKNNIINFREIQAISLIEEYIDMYMKNRPDLSYKYYLKILLLNNKTIQINIPCIGNLDMVKKALNDSFGVKFSFNSVFYNNLFEKRF